MRFVFLFLGAAGLLSGCASSQRLVDAVGSWPDHAEPASFSVDFARPDAAAADADIPAQVSRRLVEGGMTPAGTRSARYLVEIAYSARPVTVGAVLDPAEPASGAQAAWLDRPARKRGWGNSRRSQICTLMLRFSETATDKEVLRLQATEISRKAGCADLGPGLAAAALSNFPPGRP